MDTPREVTEQDFRRPEFVGEKVEDYEFRPDGKLVRKDRWQRGIYSICDALGLNTREFEIEDVVEKVESLVAALDGAKQVSFARSQAPGDPRVCGCQTCLSARAATGADIPVRMVVCAQCGNKRCPHATDHRLSCTNSNDPGQWGSAYGVRVGAIAPDLSAVATTAREVS